MKERSSPSVIAPRLLSLQQVAQYCGCSYWTARDWILSGLLQPVNLPPLRAREGERQRSTLRRVLVDREDVDRFIEARKSGHASDVQSSAPAVQADKSRLDRGTVPTVCPDDERRRA